MSNLSRRKFIYTGAGIAAAAGLGYFTKDYWSPYLEPSPSPSPNATLIQHQPQQSTVTETTAPAATVTSTHAPVETTTTETISEDELMIRELMDNWVDAWNQENLNELLSLYADKAVIDFGCTITEVHFFRGKSEIPWLYNSLFNQDIRVMNYSIREINIKTDTANLRSNFIFFKNQKRIPHNHKLNVIKITEITKGRITRKLENPIWVIANEYNHCAMDG